MADFEINEVGKKWKSLREQLMAEGYHYVHAEMTGKSFNVITISGFMKAIDEGKRFLEVPSSKFDRRPAFYLHDVRDSGVTIVTMSRDQPNLIIEPGDDWWAFKAAAYGCSEDHLHKVLRSGALSASYDKVKRAAELKEKKRILHLING